MEVLFVGLLLILFSAVQIYNPITKVNTDAFSKENFAQLKAIFSLVIVFHHLSKEVGGVVFKYFVYVGYLAVAVFFFISGFGITKKLQSSTLDAKYIGKKSLGLAFSAVVMNILYYLFVSSYESVDILEQLKLTFKYGWPFLSTTWFIFELVIYYFVFLFVSRFAKDRKVLVISMAAFGVVLNIVLYSIEYARVWQESHLAFILGIIYASYEKEIIQKLSDFKRYLSVFVVTGLLFAGSMIVLFKFEDYNLKLVMYIISALAFVELIALLMQKIELKSKLLTFLGSISMWIYLTHEMLIKIFRSQLIYINNDLIYSVCVISVSVLISYVITNVTKVVKGKSIRG